jgi:hypothetical protein
MFTAWSFSRWKTHDLCPAQAKYKFLDKLDEGSKPPALLRGGVIDKEATNYLTGQLAKLPVTLKSFAKEFAAIRRAGAEAQTQLGLTVRWQLTDWFGSQTWCRVIFDAHLRPTPTLARVIDVKTGKIYSDNQDQMELYAIAGFARYPEVREVRTELWYTDQGEERIKLYKRTELTKLQQKWRERAIPILTDKQFVPRPGAYCGWCAFSKRKGGPCKF